MLQRIKSIYKDYKEILAKFIETFHNEIGKQFFFVENNAFYVLTLTNVDVEDGVTFKGVWCFKNVFDNYITFDIDYSMYFDEFFEKNFLAKEDFLNQAPAEILIYVKEG